MSAYALRLNNSEYTSCCQCGVEFASPVLPQRRSDGGWFWCPNGHQQHYTETEERRLRKQLESAQAETQRAKADAEWQRSYRQTTERRLTAQKGLTTRAKNKLKRVENGVCPCCHRSFENLRRHIATKHPNGVAQ